MSDSATIRTVKATANGEPVFAALAVPTLQYEQPPRYGEESGVSYAFSTMINEEIDAISFLMKTRTDVKLYCRRYK